MRSIACRTGLPTRCRGDGRHREAGAAPRGGGPAAPRWRRADPGRGALGRRGDPAGAAELRHRWRADDPGGPRCRAAGDGGAHRAGEEYRALRPLYLGRQFLHPMRGGGLPPHHLLPRPAGCDDALHRDADRRQGAACRCCSRTAIRMGPATCRTAATGPAGSIRIRSRATCSPWSPATSSRCSDRFTTAGGRDVALNIWVRRGDEDRCAHAMDSLIRSMRWDEEVFGLEYDLDVFNIAAVSDFNMGAMENKGLNVFNTKYVLAKPETATDGDYQGIETVIAHEYFHNWTGNRVTCRDWFQLSLKEGLTVFRDQEFSADQGSRAVKRIRDVRGLRAAQFPEDAGPMAHPVRPDSYIEIDNFYTPTVYQKGAEVVRLIHTRIGAAAFRRGMDLYIARHDNRAVTIEEFVGAMQEASGIDLSAFMGWYDQAGTPELRRRGQLRRRGAALDPDPAAVHPADPGPGGQAPGADPGGDGAAGRRRRRAADAAGRRERGAARHPAAAAGRRRAALRLRGCGGAAGPLAAARLLRPGAAEGRFAGAAALPRGARHRPLRALGKRAAIRRRADARHGRGAAARRGAATSTRRWPRRCRPRCAAPRPTRPSPPRRWPCRAKASSPTRWRSPIRQAIHAVRQHLRREIGRRCGATLRASYDSLAEAGAYQVDGRSIGRGRCAIPASPIWWRPATPVWRPRNTTPRPT